MTKKQTQILKIGAGIITIGILLGVWVILSQRQANENNSAQSEPKLVSLQSDSQILPQYKNYAYVVSESWLKDSGFKVKKRLYPATDSTGVIRFNVPTEYFEVGLSTDSDKGATNINIVAASIRSSGVTVTHTKKELDDLFKNGTLTGTYDTVRKLADGRTKAEIATSGCLVSASAFETDKLRTFVDALISHCAEVLKKK
jgi:hypothetical protein